MSYARLNPLLLDATACPDRTSRHEGRTATVASGNIQIHYDAELRDATCCTKFRLCLACREFDLKRSYLYVRENSIERNVASKCCCCSESCSHDHVVVNYFDRQPFKQSCCFCGMICGLIPVCFCLDSTKPKFEILKGGVLCCCCHCCNDESCCCCEDNIVIMPSENLPCPCCCCPNRVSWCNNCCGCCGQPTGKYVLLDVAGVSQF